MLFDDPASLDPAEVVAWFNVCDSGLALKEVETYSLLGRGTDQSSLPEIIELLGIGASEADIRDYFDSCRRELNISAVLALTASAEARIRLEADERIRRTDDLAQRLRVLRESASTPWKIRLYDEGIVDAWKSYIASIANSLGDDRHRLLHAIGQFKGLLDLRHWVAHGRYWKPKRGIEHFPPATAAEIVINLYKALNDVAVHRGIGSFS